VPWEIDEGLYGVAYELGDGQHGADLIGAKSEAVRIISDMARHRAKSRLAAVVVTERRSSVALGLRGNRQPATPTIR
jgi:hypothetical protein